MTRARQADRLHWTTGDPVTLFCECGWRLGLLEVRSDLGPEPVAFGIYFMRNGGQIFEAPIAGDYRRITCTACGKDWHGPVSHITELVSAAQTQKTQRVTLSLEVEGCAENRPHEVGRRSVPLREGVRVAVQGHRRPGVAVAFRHRPDVHSRRQSGWSPRNGAGRGTGTASGPSGQIVPLRLRVRLAEPLQRRLPSSRTAPRTDG